MARSETEEWRNYGWFLAHHALQREPGGGATTHHALQRETGGGAPLPSFSRRDVSKAHLDGDQMACAVLAQHHSRLIHGDGAA